MPNATSLNSTRREGPAFRVGRRSRRVRVLTPAALLRSLIGAGIVGLMLLRLVPDGAVAAKALAQTGGTCRVVSVIDGDTVAIWCAANGMERARLLGFDTPEVFSPKCASELKQGQQATQALRRLLLDAGDVRIVKEGRDRYGRSLVRIWIDGAPVARRMIADGHGRAYQGGVRGGWCT